MEELSIKIKIGDREYPMRIKTSEEEKLRIAGRQVNEKMKQYGQNYGIDDKQDLLAMVAFDAMVQKVKLEMGQSENEFDIESKLEELDNMISKSINK